MNKSCKESFTIKYNDYKKLGYTKERFKEMISQIQLIIAGSLLLHDVVDNRAWYNEDDMLMDTSFANDILEDKVFNITTTEDDIIIEVSSLYITYRDLLEYIFLISNQNNTYDVKYPNSISYNLNTTNDELKNKFPLILLLISTIDKRDVKYGYELIDNTLTIYGEIPDNIIILLTINTLINILFNVNDISNIIINEKEIYNNKNDDYHMIEKRLQTHNKRYINENNDCILDRYSKEAVNWCLFKYMHNKEREDKVWN